MSKEVLAQDELKRALKEAITEAFSEHQDVLRAIVVDALEDLGLGQAMREGEATEFVDRTRIDELLEGRS